MAVSHLGLPVEALLNCLIEKTCIQKANKVKSTNELLVPVFGGLAAAYIALAINA